MRKTLGLLSALAVMTCGTARGAADAEARFDVHVDGAKLRARIAITHGELTKGLMHTKALAADEGMLFIFLNDARRAFWMRNVSYDIDAGYFTSDGTLTQIVKLRANDETPVPSQSEKVRFVMEAPAGWFAGAGLKPGAKLALSDAAAAVNARGFQASYIIPRGEVQAKSGNP